MSEETHKVLHVVLTPEFDGLGNATAISFLLRLQSPSVAADEPLVYLILQKGKVPSQRYDGDRLQASDEAGKLTLKATDEGLTRRWLPTRATSGDVVLKFRAIPRFVDINTPVGARIDLRAESGGLQGNTLSMIPIPPGADEKNRQIFRIALEWDLSCAPAGTSAVWTFGEGPAAHERIGPAIDLVPSWIMVGPIRRHVPAGLQDESYGFYYFGDLPQQILGAAKTNAMFFPKIAEFFGDPPSIANPYRVFVRQVPRGFGGSAFTRTYLLEHDSSVGDVQPDELERLLCHEIVHNWPLMEYEFQKSGQVDHNMWYNEGIAEFYGALLPYNSQFWNRSVFLLTINGHLLSYYTNPFITRSNREAQDHAWEENFNMTLPYKRGFVYFLILNQKIREKSGGIRSLDDLVRVLLQRRLENKYYGLEVWLSLLQAELGPEAIAAHEAMASGTVLRPDPDCLPGFKLIREDKEPFEMGFAESSLSASPRAVKGVVAGSRADQAGLRDGDVIQSYTWLWQSTVDYAKIMKVVVRREDDLLDIQYWPRGWQKVECWQFVPL